MTDIRNWSFFKESNGGELTRGWQGLESQAHRHAQQLANDLGEAVEYIPESELNDGAGAGDDWEPPTGITVEPNP